MTASVTHIHLGSGKPTRVTIEMGIEEALVITRMCGQLTGRNPATTVLWDCLTDELFNRFWDDGVDDATRHLEAPPLEQLNTPDADKSDPQAINLRCSHCNGSGCPRCNGTGWVIES